MTAAPPNTPADTPRTIEPHAAFYAVVDWVAHIVRAERAPGLIVGLSGTDSILTFLACAAALRQLGKPQRMLGVHFVHHGKDQKPAAAAPFNFFTQDVLPFLHAQAPEAQIEINDTIAENNDALRWGALFSRAVRDVGARDGMADDHYFVVGTRNATEQALGTYSQISKSVSMLPILDLYKSEVLEICAARGVPQSALAQSCQVDCACGRFDTQAHYIRELDLLIMERKGLITRAAFERAVTGTARTAVREFYVEETARNGFRLQTPYSPASRPLVSR